MSDLGCKERIQAIFRAQKELALRAAVYRGFGSHATCFLWDKTGRLAQGEGKAKVWYTGFALSDLAVSGSLLEPRQLAFYRFSPSPYSVAT
jgi:hypothetical protein